MAGFDANLAHTGLDRFENIEAYLAVGLNTVAASTPSVPASGTPQSNTTSKWVDVYVLSGGATIASIAINGTSVGCTSLSATDPTLFRVPPGGTITLTYSVATPTWVWI